MSLDVTHAPCPAMSLSTIVRFDEIGHRRTRFGEVRLISHVEQRCVNRLPRDQLNPPHGTVARHGTVLGAAELLGAEQGRTELLGRRSYLGRTGARFGSRGCRSTDLRLPRIGNMFPIRPETFTHHLLQCMLRISAGSGEPGQAPKHVETASERGNQLSGTRHVTSCQP